jgi:hypothetical protein
MLSVIMLSTLAASSFEQKLSWRGKIDHIPGFYDHVLVLFIIGQKVDIKLVRHLDQETFELKHLGPYD